MRASGKSLGLDNLEAGLKAWTRDSAACWGRVERKSGVGQVILTMGLNRGREESLLLID